MRRNGQWAIAIGYRYKDRKERNGERNLLYSTNIWEYGQSTARNFWNY
jgi:hypothetical protein